MKTENLKLNPETLKAMTIACVIEEVERQAREIEELKQRREPRRFTRPVFSISDEED